jgi:hypothetical protein
MILDFLNIRVRKYSDTANANDVKHSRRGTSVYKIEEGSSSANPKKNA